MYKPRYLGYTRQTSVKPKSPEEHNNCVIIIYNNYYDRCDVGWLASVVSVRRAAAAVAVAARPGERGDRLGKRGQHPAELCRANRSDTSGQLRAEPVALGTVSGRRAVRLRLLRCVAAANRRIVRGVHGAAGRVARRPTVGVRHDQPVLATHRPDGVRTRDEADGKTELTAGRWIGARARGHRF